MGTLHTAYWTFKIFCCCLLFPATLSTLPFVPQPDPVPAAEPSGWFGAPGGSSFMVPPPSGSYPDMNQQQHHLYPYQPSYPYPPQSVYPVPSQGNVWETNPSFQCDGVCYTESSCLRSGGIPGRGCRDGNVCCTFQRSCNQMTQMLVSFFRSPDFPNLSRSNTVCHHHILLRSDVCAVRLEFEEFHLIPPSNGVCSVDQFLIMGGLQGPSYPRCGDLDGYTTVVSVSPRSGRTLGLLMVIQNPAPYRWNIRATQIRCSKLRPFREWPECGYKVKPPPSSTTQPMYPTKSYNPDTDDVSSTRAPSTTTATTTTTTTTTPPSTTTEATTERREPSTLWPIYPQPQPPRNGKKLTLNVTQVQLAEGWTAASTSSNLRNELMRQEQTHISRVWPVRQLPEVNLSVTCPGNSREDPPSRIVGGSDARPFEFPWQAAVFSDNKYVCSGSAITPNFVLTAAHCFFTTDTKIENVKIIFGDINITDSGGGTQVVRRVSRIFFHSHFNIQDLINDLALVMLDKPVAFSYAIRPICMPNPRFDYAGIPATVAGWGYTVNPGTPSPILQKLDVNIINTNTCSTILGNQPPLLPSMVCAAADGCRSTCFGDSGGPLMVKESKGRTVVVGILSFGLTVGCAVVPNFPEVYTRISEYFNWIGANMVI